ncbi:hypothetical protein JTE90_022986 [Oedothorax gibbosus]|uniref:GDP-D-glucose phosphorylase 1 n=1 Tax=Oedothorax gibbosus TaxID=931172 RepID=A0AAV6VBC5_9ARAC|nr:hypothetical protein JTE90_022986 [Oedothorax gibbosus]
MNTVGGAYHVKPPMISKSGSFIHTMALTISYDNEEFFFITRRDSGEKSLIDEQLQTIWSDKVATGCFKYELGDLSTKQLFGKYGFVVQLNENRATKRRKPQLVFDVAMEFNPHEFHFGKVPEKEVIFIIQPQHWLEREKNSHVLLINVSPLEYCHSLLVPSIEKCLPQILKADEFRLAVELMLKSKDSFFRIGFNSLGAFASVNHLHFHAYYLKYELFIENAPTKHLVDSISNPCAVYELLDFPAEGFVFEILEDIHVFDVTRSVVKLTDCLLANNIAHNVFLTRGRPLSKPTTDYSELNALRIYVWAREAHYGVKDGNSFNVAVCELAGHIPMKDQESFKNITEEAIASELYKACHETFTAVRPIIKNMFHENL